ncbi:nucleotidyl transferase AbiEii/AbiGii toxin family protein [Parasphingorhabdus sp.]|uniref:nucleotidyl transferase AbiEii/AbiGii toxin family protein n=1 Tax=Parasphingorhabdus sp. TaxID=2709688 RepID=UPI002F94CF25
MLLHESEDFGDLIDVCSRDLAIDPGLIEKDYWIMHSLWGLQQLGFHFELKGGTSLSKGFGVIHRFSEDIDILIHPRDGDVLWGKNHNKPKHVEARRGFFDALPDELAIPGITSAERDELFDDHNMRSAGIRLYYVPHNDLPDGVKSGILLEAGFDQVSPNRPCSISSWAYDKAVAAGLEDLTDNRAMDVACYEPGYTFVEKLQTISTKFRRHLEDGSMPNNFLRHYYDLYCLLDCAEVQAFIGTDEYFAHKKDRFPQADEIDIRKNPAFALSDEDIRAKFETAYANTAALYYREQPVLTDIIARVQKEAARL